MDSNFSFLKDEFPILFNIGVSAENYLHRDPVYCLSKLRLFGEKLTQLLFEEHALEFPRDNSFHNQLVMLSEEDILPTVVKDMLFLLKKKGNIAVHDSKGSLREAKEALESVFLIGKWYYTTYAFENQSLSKLVYVEPVYTDEKLERQKWEEEYKSLEAKFNELLAERKTDGISEERQKVILERSEKAARKIEMSEAQTRVLIDEMLRKAGWEVDTNSLNHKLHKTMPEKGKNRAIAEWPAGSLWADYALFVGTELYGLVEAKKYAQDISTDLRQTKIYAENIKATNGITLLGKWDKYCVPFLFSTNGRPYLEQLKTKSGIWFLDAREKTNIARPLQGWYSPEGLVKLRAKDLQEANQKLAATPLQFLESKSGLGLRKYQIKAIEAIEHQIINYPDIRRALVAMATGTGKTRTVIGLCYHLIQTNRFHRILFLVDRTLLGIQAINAFKDNKIVDLNTFADIYDIKGFKNLLPNAETRLHFATVQGMVKRLFYNDTDEQPSVDQYDCIIIDEAHRGYLLDREIDEEGLNFKNQQEYVSKYRMVLDYFDAYAIGLTATPALHTTEIFGKPIYTYSYREAVIDGFLIDHDPPYLIRTQLGEEGIEWKKGEKPKVYDKETNTVVELDELADELQIDVAGFNKQVLTESFNRTVVKQLVQQLDPDGNEKTLIFAATDDHADNLVQYLKEEFQLIGINVADDSIQKITGKSYNPPEQLTRYKNEKYPTIAVTVDLLTTGIDVPAICNIVFIRRVKSRILYEQMLGRATRRCDDIQKETFRIYDAVRLYEALEDYTQMKPVVVNPKATFLQLAEECTLIDSEERAKMQLEQIIAKIQRKKRALDPDSEQTFTYYSGSTGPDEFIKSLQTQPVQESIQRVAQLATLWRFLDELKMTGSPMYVSEHEDSFRSMDIGYGIASKPEDYLNSFAQYLRENQNKITALNIVCTRPAELNRKSLKELLLLLDRDGYRPRAVGAAWKQARNEDVGADIISIIRTLAVGSTLESHDERIKKAVNKVRTMRSWNKVQQKWIDRFEKQLLAETVLQPEDLNESPFDDAGGFQQLDKVFENQLGQVIQTINQHLYPQTA
ncbi:type I restriction-modification system endonuclease [Runella slithyformis]|uniref:Type I site-specific deoxyribonuclease n=1 Tax=Runella slithyformis (strain ATCC 29530 / DSM 19594 / LMG 11500 / NCIMB 11436 / LSU 4) TaxID=761193 RepID=A0A7U4E6L7_RUNSL|nr:type I restriction-modification system endonuclease [Runella slithyformis]AEI49713.1 Type I site-specific deoxyribonuclease [Runella slithyformis DSM 19594]